MIPINIGGCASEHRFKVGEYTDKMEVCHAR